MTSARAVRGCRAALPAVAAVLSLAAGPKTASAQQPSDGTRPPSGATESRRARRAVIVGAVRDALLERVRGQTGDLDWELVLRPAAQARREGIGDVRRIARAANASVALWFVEEPDAITVLVVEVEQARLFARRLQDEREGEVMSESARLEAAALVVRGALRDLAQGGHIGVVVASAPPPARAEGAHGAREDVRGRAGLAQHAGVPVRFAASAGWALVIDGVSGAGQHGPTATLAIERRWWRLEGAFVTSLGSAVTDARATVRLTRHAFRLGAGVVIEASRSLALAALATAGLVLLERTTVEVAPGVVAAPESGRLLGSFGVLARLSWFPIARALGVEATIGLDVVPAAPVLAYLDDAQIVERARLWVPEPWLSLGLVVRSGRH